MKNYTILILALILLSSCASVYLAPNGEQIAQNHQTVAILKSDVSYKARKNDDLNALNSSAESSAYEFQQEIYKWMLTRKSTHNFNVNFQDVSETNSKYKKAFGDTNIKELATEEICRALNVDGIIVSNFYLSKPMSNGGALALGLLTGVYGATNEAIVSIAIKNCEDKSLLWQYDHKLQGGLLTTPSSLVDALMRHASKKMPYNLK